MFFGERWFGFDDGMYSACRLAEILSGSDSGLAPLLADWPAGDYPACGDLAVR